MFPGITPTKFGHRPVALTLNPARLHLHQGGPLREVEWEPPIPILDQEDLDTQGIDTSTLIAGAPKVKALGSCSCNAGTAHLAERVAAATGSTAAFSALTLQSASGPVTLSPAGSTTDEEFAILLYHYVNQQPGAPADWPPTDGGSNGVFVCSEFEKRGWAASYKSASGMANVASLIQQGSVMMGGPYLKAWMEPNAAGFVDGDGSVESLMLALTGGVAGGHETLLAALERLVLDAVGNIDLVNSWFRVRNSWSRAFADNGEYRVHLSTLGMLGSHFDFKQAIVKTA